MKKLCILAVLLAAACQTAWAAELSELIASYNQTRAGNFVARLGGTYITDSRKTGHLLVVSFHNNREEVIADALKTSGTMESRVAAKTMYCEFLYALFEDAQGTADKLTDAGITGVKLNGVDRICVF